MSGEEPGFKFMINFDGKASRVFDIFLISDDSSWLFSNPEIFNRKMRKLTFSEFIQV